MVKESPRERISVSAYSDSVLRGTPLWRHPSGPYGDGINAPAFPTYDTLTLLCDHRRQRERGSEIASPSIFKSDKTHGWTMMSEQAFLRGMMVSDLSPNTPQAVSAAAEQQCQQRTFHQV